QALGTLRRKGTLAMNGLPPGSFELDIFNAVLNRITIRGSIVGTRKDLQESIDFATEGKVTSNVHSAGIDDINGVIEDMRANKIEGRMVLDIA
ncbi:MAG TPA: zinc-binding dehydrogenase, partial [Balneolaceae bacterium]|nr:zinc-binding dehydrogenase [Balneolaceae bacterium]